jgi:hypothetical protein
MTDEQEKKFLFGHYDLTMAVTARRMLQIETHPLSECLEQVYKPVKEVLNELTEHKPSALRLICEGPFAYAPNAEAPNFPGLSALIYAVLPDNRVLYLCTVVTKNLAEALFEWRSKVYGNSKDSKGRKRRKKRAILKILERRGPMAISSERTGCKVPVSSDGIGAGEMENGVGRFMRLFTPALASVSIVWISEKLRQGILACIKDYAQKTAKYQTREECKKIILEDIVCL